MMGRTHAATGAAAGCALALAYGTATGHTGDPALLVAGTLLGTGAALGPDIDHPNATATHAHGWASRVLGWCVRKASALAYRLTATTADTSESGEHRHLTHTPLAGLVLGGFVAAAAALWWQVAAVVLWATISLALRGAAAIVPGVRARRDTSTWIAVSALSIAATGALLSWGGVAVAGPYIGACVAAGWITHIAGDALTRTAVPLAWPLTVGGQRWHMLGAPRWLRFSTGSWVEHVIGVASWGVPAVTAYALLP